MRKQQIASKGFLKLTAKKLGQISTIISSKDEFSITQMKLKLALPVTDLCQPVEISGYLCTKIFNSCIQKQPLFFRRAILLKKTLWLRSFAENFGKFLRTPFLQNTSWRLLLCIRSMVESFNSFCLPVKYGIHISSHTQRIHIFQKFNWENRWLRDISLKSPKICNCKMLLGQIISTTAQLNCFLVFQIQQ